MNERERAMQLLDSVPDYKIPYVIAYLQGVTAGEEESNAETIAAFEELENGGGECFNSLDDLWTSREE